MTTLTRGGAALAAWLVKHGVSHEDLALRLETHQTTVSRLIRGQVGPTLRVAHSIETITEIPTEWWEEPVRK